MNEKIISKAEFDQGIELFLKILSAQPGLLEPSSLSNLSVKTLAKTAADFAVELHKLKGQYCVD